MREEAPQHKSEKAHILPPFSVFTQLDERYMVWFYIHCKTVSNFHQAQICIFHERSINRKHTRLTIFLRDKLISYWILGRFCRFESWKICENISHRTSYSLVSVPYMAGISNYVHLCKQGWVRLTTMLKVF